jgi:cytidine deaminase
MTSESSEIEALIALALEAREGAYAPYSNFKVGCALRTEDGSEYSGANVENASYGLCICAERNAISAAVLAGHREISAMAIVTQSSPPAAPCGMCRQTINEFVSDPTKLVLTLVNPEGERRDIGFAELFPHGFRGSDIT